MAKVGGAFVGNIGALSLVAEASVKKPTPPPPPPPPPPVVKKGWLRRLWDAVVKFFGKLF